MKSVWTRVGAIGAVGIAMIGVVDMIGAPTGAQSADTSAEVVSVNLDLSPVAGVNTSPSVSDDGAVVVFSHEVTPTGGVPEHFVVVRRRAVGDKQASTLQLPAGLQATEASVSGNGCTVAYSAVVPTPPSQPSSSDPTGSDATPAGDASPPVGVAGAVQVETLVVELRIANLCGEPAAAVVPRVIDSFNATKALPAPALSRDGVRIVWPTLDGLRLYDALSSPAQPVFVPINSGVAGHIVGPHLDIAADGMTVVFESGPPVPNAVPPAGGLESSTIYRWTIGPADATGVTPILVAPLATVAVGGTRPTMSDDASTVVFQRNTPDAQIVGAPATGPYLVIVDVATPEAARLLTSGAENPAIAGNGLSVAYDTKLAAGVAAVRVRRSDSGMGFAQSTEKIVSYGVTNPVASVGASVTGPALTGDGSVVVFDAAVGAALSTDAKYLLDGHVWARSTEPIFNPPATTTTTDSTTTTAPVATIPIATGPVATVSTSPPNTTRPTSNTTRPTANTTRPTTNTTRPTTTTTTVPLPPVFEPAAFEFAPTIIDAGRRTADVELVNPSPAAITVVDVRIDPPGETAFTVESTTCSGPLAPAARCVVSLSFAPTVVGEITANLVADVGDATLATSALRGVGAPPPTLSVLPGVAANGQVVTVFGAGFPAGASVDFSWNQGRVTSVIVVGDTGGFAHTLVILPNTTIGPVEMSVAGQIDLFGDVATSMLVSQSSSRSNTAVFGGVGNGGGLGR